MTSWSNKLEKQQRNAVNRKSNLKEVNRMTYKKKSVTTWKRNATIRRYGRRVVFGSGSIYGGEYFVMVDDWGGSLLNGETLVPLRI